MSVRVFSMFSGIGGFELGIQQSDINTELVGYAEIDKYAISIFEKQFTGVTNYGDATTIEPWRIPDFDLLVGGFPCQAFSIAGKHQGFNDTRGTLFFDIARICAEKRPRYLVLENVKGLLSHDNGQTFETILRVLADLGYRVEWQVLNSKDFGVPQNRERVFIVGHLGGTSGRQVFPITGTSQTASVVALRQLNKAESQANRIYDIDGITPSLRALGGGLGAKTGLYKVDKPRILDASYRNKGIREYKDYSPTLKSRDYKEPRYVDEGNGMRIRRLTPTECERLQGFPDGWTAGLSDTQRYKTLGNAVTVPVVTAVMNKLQRIN